MKLLIAVCLVLNVLFAQDKLIIDAGKFEADDKKGITIFSGNVNMKRANDTLKSKRLEVYMTPRNDKQKVERKPLKYIAIGNVTFQVKSSNKVYEGKGDKVVYDPTSQKYTIIGNGSLKEKSGEKVLIGSKIYIDQKSGEAKVVGTKDKPVRFIMNIKSEKNENN